MWRLAAALLLLGGMIPVGPAALAGTSCTDVSRTFTGTVQGTLDEALLGTSIDARDHALELGSQACRVVSIDATLTAREEDGPEPAVGLTTSYEGIEVAASRTLSSSQSLHLDEAPVGTYAFTVEPQQAADARYELDVTADLAVDPAPAGPNADDETVVIAVPDTGINPYHEEFSAESYPGNLSLTENPADYIEGYPESAQRLDLSLDRPFAQAVENDRWHTVEEETLYWIPGTKIVGAYHAHSTGEEDTTAILDKDGHGTHSASVATGNTLGACPSCLLVAINGFRGYSWAIQQPWIDLVSNSWGTSDNAGLPNGPTEVDRIGPLSFPESGAAEDLRGAVTRGQTVLWASGNGYANAFLTPQPTYTSPFKGPDWTINVGGTRAFNGITHCDCSRDEGAAVTSGQPVDVSSYAVGYIPAASHESTQGRDQHSGTSAATPRVAGEMGEVLLAARQALGDRIGTTRDPAIAEGPPVSGAHPGMLGDGKLTRAELERAIKLTAQHSQSESVDVVPVTPPTFLVPEPLLPAQYVVEGWGVVADRTGEHAREVVLGQAPIPDRPLDQKAADADEANREALWGPAVEP